MTHFQVDFKKFYKRSISIIVCLLLAFSLFGCANNSSNSNANSNGENNNSTQSQDLKIGISWKTNDESKRDEAVFNALKETGVTPVYLNQVVDYDLTYDGDNLSTTCNAELGYLNEDSANKVKNNTYKNSNVEDVLKDIDGVVFTGGEDISPSLYKEPQGYDAPTTEIDFNSTRDVSDYLLVSYCIDKDIKSLGICRGMQMVSVVSGCSMIQDIPTFYERQGITYNNLHRNKTTTSDGFTQYANHEVSINDNESFLHKIYNSDDIKGVVSSHHQAVKSVEGTNLKVAGFTPTDGIDIIEAVQRTDKNHIFAVQFHPEVAVKKYLAGESIASIYMSKEDSLKIFRWVFCEN